MALAATAASAAEPPRSSMRRPARVARGWLVATIALDATAAGLPKVWPYLTGSVYGYDSGSAYGGEPTMITLYDAPRCPFCARARIVLAEKHVEYDTVVVDLDERPGWIVELNPPDGRVPVPTFI